MKITHALAVCAAALLGVAALPAQAGSLVTSSAAGGSSASSASSASVGASSDSVTKTAAADGPYRITDVAAVPERPGTVRVTLQALAVAGPQGEYQLYMPQQALDKHQLGAGQTIVASPRAYGTEFAVADTRKAFFLVVSDEWERELASNPVVL
ncbi:MAG TPA: hypothetical protein VIW70_12935 [Rubrivivax sp.]